MIKAIIVMLGHTYADHDEIERPLSFIWLRDNVKPSDLHSLEAREYKCFLMKLMHTLISLEPR